MYLGKFCLNKNLLQEIIKPLVISDKTHKMGKKVKSPVSGKKKDMEGIAVKSKAIQKPQKDRSVAGFEQKKSDNLGQGKKKPPMKMAKKLANAEARLALASGEVGSYFFCYYSCPGFLSYFLGTCSRWSIVHF